MSSKKIEAALAEAQLADLTYVEKGSPLWDRMWAALAGITGGDTVEEHPETGECWQYMGTHRGVHQFRHRDRPRLPGAVPRQLSSGVGFGRVYLDVHAD